MRDPAGKGTSAEPLPQLIRGIVDRESRAGRLIASADLIVEMAGRGYAAESVEEGLEAVLGDEVRELTGPGDTIFYYSLPSMTDDYARVLAGTGDPLRLIAETVRESSARYPRPLALDLLREPPFGFSDQEISAFLEQITRTEEYRDIASLKTSMSNVYLFSTWHLDPEHAAMLAEWMETGISDNP